VIDYVTPRIRFVTGVFVINDFDVTPFNIIDTAMVETIFKNIERGDIFLKDPLNQRDE